MHHYQAVIQVPFGTLGISMNADRLSGIDFISGPVEPMTVDDSASGVVERVRRYLRDPRSSLEIGLELQGTDFQRRVWRRLLEIPVGTTVTYGQLAAELGSSARAIGNACRNNPCPLVVPCHRVVSQNGLGGFSGQLAGPKLEIKRWLLTHEGCLDGDLERND
jgi:methylated-DNA-[protein]-cysteine S-methyltransferase